MFTNTQVLDAVASAIESRLAVNPDYFYNHRIENPEGMLKNGTQCVYRRDGETHGSCLVGRALIDFLGVPYNDEWEGASAYALFETSCAMSVEDLADIDRKIYDLVDAWQSMQDQGTTYVAIKERFEADVALLKRRDIIPSDYVPTITVKDAGYWASAKPTE